MTKLFGTSETLLRLQVALRHAVRALKRNDEPEFVVGDLRVDLG